MSALLIFMVHEGCPIWNPVKAIMAKTTEITLNANALTRLIRWSVLCMLPHARAYLNMVDPDVARATWTTADLLVARPWLPVYGPTKPTFTRSCPCIC